MHQAVAACRASLTLVHKWRANMDHDQEAPMPNTQFRISTFGESSDETTITQPNNVTTLNQDSTEQEEHRDATPVDRHVAGHKAVASCTLVCDS